MTPLPPLLELFPEPVFAVLPGGRIVSANRAAEAFSGRAQIELGNLQLSDLLSPQSCSVVLPHWRNRATGFNLQADFLHASGRTIPVDLFGSVDDSGTLQFIARETGERRSEDAPRNSETRFRFMAKNLTEMVLAYDMDRRLTFVNSAAQSLTGYSAEELERAQFINWVHPDDRARMLSYWDRLFEGRSFHEEEYRLITRDGRVKWVAASWGPILDDLGHQVGVQGREREVTDRHMAEETLRQSEQHYRLSEERYRALFEDSPFPMWEEDFSQLKVYLAGLKAQGVTNLRSYLAANREAVAECLRGIRVVDVNRAARQFYGAETKEELLGGLEKFFDAVAWENFREEVACLDENNSSYKAEFRARTVSGEERTVTMIVSIAAPQDWSRVIVSFFDITDRKRLEEQVLQSQKLESLGRLAGGIAHDFNNLLMVILGYADILLSSAEGDVALTTGLNEIRTAGERGAELTAQLLAFSRKQVLQPRSFSLNALIRESYGMLQRLIGEDVQLEISLEPGLWNLRADRGQIHQVLMNLVVNGRDAMPFGGLISLTTRNVPQHPQGECVVLEVRDTGVGMDESTRAHVFEPFFTTKRRGKGAGLGMATVFGVVTQAGGQISVESELGKGSCFRLYFPRESAPVERESTPATPAAANRLRGVILVVEDQAEVRLVTCKMLRNLGLEVVDADNAETALAFARSHPVDLLFTDVIMPGMNGRELASRFLELHPRSRVVYMSGYTDRVLGENGMVDPSIVLLQKPFNPADVARVISDELERLDRQEIRS